ncbi:MAG TPA: hypothetical protein VN493_18775 [Thermoanaerobaculia bacterium]|nr:hypothetical protein [Thermoanaerobaculia bacterium]
MAEMPQYMKRVAGWDLTNTAVVANVDDLRHLEVYQADLDQKADRFRALIARQAAQRASKQETSREIKELFRETETLVDYIRTGVRQHYGLNSQKLVEFGIKPTGRRARAAKPAPPPGPEAPAPAESVSDPDTAK